MKVRTFREYLRDIYHSGEGENTLYFSDQDVDYYTITDVYEDCDGDICLEAGDGSDYTAEELYDALRGYSGDSYIYVYGTEEDIYWDIEGGWYFDDDDDLTMDMVY